VSFEDVYCDRGSSNFLCGRCNGLVKFKGEFLLGKTYRTPGCPVSKLTERAGFFIQLVNWSDEVGVLPTAKTLFEESMLYFEIRNFVISERSIAEEEMSPKEDTRK